MGNIYDKNFNKNVVEVYTEEIGFTGFKGLEWNKLDSLEDILQNGIDVNVTNFAAQSAYVDAFGRQRISNPFTLADYSHVYGEETELLTKTNGTNSSTSKTCRGQLRRARPRLHDHALGGASPARERELEHG